MKTLASLIKHLESNGVLNNSLIYDAFKKIDRKDFVEKDLLSLAYEDIPLSIGNGQTISQPYTVAFMLSLLDPKKDEKILDVGSGSGYTTALLAEIVGEKGVVIGVEIIPELVNFGMSNLKKYNLSNAKIYQAGDILGVPHEAPFDKILVSAASVKIPEELINQLKNGGTMVIPVENDIYKIDKNKNGELEIEKYSGFIFVPLIENK